MNSTKPFTPPAKAKLSSCVALVDQADLHAVVQEAQLAQAALARIVVVEVDVAEDLVVGQEVHLGAALLGGSPVIFIGLTEAVALLDHAVLRHAARNSMCVPLPSRRTVRRSHFDSALTQDTPTPCRPPDTL